MTLAKGFSAALLCWRRSTAAVKNPLTSATAVSTQNTAAQESCLEADTADSGKNIHVAIQQLLMLL